LSAARGRAARLGWSAHGLNREFARPLLLPEECTEIRIHGGLDIDLF
jgi:hypothetical protein